MQTIDVKQPAPDGAKEPLSCGLMQKIDGIQQSAFFTTSSCSCGLMQKIDEIQPTVEWDKKRTVVV